MPDIDPAALSRPSNISTPLLSTKSLSSFGSAQKAKSSQIPGRIDLEPLYSELKQAIGAEHWQIYKEATTEFFIGRDLPRIKKTHLSSFSDNPCR